MHSLLILMHFPLFTKVAENNTAMGEHVKYKITHENLTIQLQSWSIIQNRNSDVGKTQGITLINPSNTHTCGVPGIMHVNVTAQKSLSRVQKVC